MILTQILQLECVKVPLAGTDKDSVIKELVDLLDAAKLLLDKDEVLQAVLSRENTRSTGIGSGIAIPHGKCKGVRDLVMAIGVSPRGIDFQSIDGKPVYIFVLLVSPIDKTGPHIQALARISRLMLDEDFKNKLQSAASAEQLYNLISEKEAE
jgi:fructose-specific phosphotransferase system IIA component